MNAESIRKRKLDVHNKIQLGGLVIKAELDYLFHDNQKDVLLGALLHLKTLLEDPICISQFRSIGMDKFHK